MKLELEGLKSDNHELKNSIVAKIRDLILIKNLEPGDKLPSERSLAAKFDVSRGIIRESIQRLEFYGLVKSMPQSGTFIADIGPVALNGMVDDIVNLSKPDFKSLVETRVLLELKAVEMAAIKRTDSDLKNLENSLNNYADKVEKGIDAIQDDLLFHLAIAKASGNSTLHTLMLTITPGIITNFDRYHVCDLNLTKLGVKEHNDIFEAIKRRDPIAAKKMLKVHFKALYEYIVKD